MADGPVRWGLPVPSRKAGLYVVELGAALPTAPLELTKVGKWLEHLPALRLEGEHPNSRALQARLASFWWPNSTVLYAGATDRSIGGRVAGLLAHNPGDRQPHNDGQWLHLLRGLDRLGLRIWWAETAAPEESLDAFFDAFGEGRISPPNRPAGALALPWANTRRPTGERQVHGITGAVLPEVPRVPEPERRIVEVAPGDADGARLEERGSGTTRRAPATPRAHAPVVRPLRPATPPSAAPRVATSTPRAKQSGKILEPIQLSQGALDRMHVELDELTRVTRREVVARIKSAREHGDLKENAEYQAAREEQSFLEGRVQALEDRIRRAVVVDEVATGRVMIGSTVRVENDGDELTYTIVGSTEANPALGRLSSASPVGAALMGAVAGKTIEVRTPRGTVSYRVIAVD
ncbi:MAG TPA: transcription elongation factor GreA [Candidatus Limnocylindria bacterium]|nr:transcription elongation factor GreA [Candidatus Limnocylindria bacterium]